MTTYCKPTSATLTIILALAAFLICILLSDNGLVDDEQPAMPDFHTLDATYAHTQNILPTSEPAEIRKEHCIMHERTALCKNGAVDMTVLLRGRYAGMDCFTYDFIDDVAALGPSVIAEWEDTCAGINPGLVPLPAPPLQYNTSVDVIACRTDDGTQISFKDEEEQSRMQGQHNISSCVLKSVVVRRNNKRCNDTIAVSLCDGKDIDTNAFDANVRDDCAAFELRDALATNGLAGIQQFVAECNGILTQDDGYSESCANNMTIERDTSLLLIRLENTYTFHLHYHKISGLVFLPVIQSFGALPCESTICTSSLKQSCWPRPRFSSGSSWDVIPSTVYTCEDNDNPKVHVVGYFRGTMKLRGHIRKLDEGNECDAYYDGISVVEIYAAALSWCGVWINALPGGVAKQSTGTMPRNVCNAF